MSYRHALGTFGAAAVALLAPLALATPAAASSQLSPAVSTAMQRDFGLDAAQAQAKADRENAAARTDQALQKQLGASYSGSFVDQAGVLTVRTTDPAAANAITQAGARPVVSKKDPNATKAKLDRSAKNAARSVGSWYVDEKTGSVVVEATKAADAQAFIATSGAAADGVQVKQVAQDPRPFATLIGGNAIQNSQGRCSIGFSARSSATGNSYVITAGHCTQLGGTWTGFNGVTIGAVAASNFPSTDYGAIRVNSTTTWRPSGQVAGLTTVTGSTAAAVGASTCRSGSTTGVHCGTIQAKNATVNYGGGNIVNGLTQTSACAEPGDSGGSFTSGSQAQGMTSGGSGDCTVGGTTFFQPINAALSAYGLTLVTGA